MVELRLYLAQRISAAVMAPLVLLHLGVIIYAIQDGLDASEILSRTRGSLLWGSVYGIFVLAVSIHAAIGLRSILREWGQIRGMLLSVISWGVLLLLMIAGLRALVALVGIP